MPQVQVALRALAEGKSVRVNDVISYITTTASEASSDAPAKRAYSPLDVQKSSGAMKPDIDWYLAKQIFPPIERLCAPIPGTDAGQLAECLGLDAKRYALGNSNRGDSIGSQITPLDSQLPDALRYKDCERLTLACLSCKNNFIFGGLDGSSQAVTPEGVVCPADGCGKPFRTLTLVAQVEHAIRQLTSKYYDGWLVCDDLACNSRTRDMSVYGHRCLGPTGMAKGCLGRMSWEMSGKNMGATLGYWKGLWGVEKGAADTAAVDDVGKERLKVLGEWNRERFEVIKNVVEGYERRCGWVWVQMDSLFGFALK